MFVPHFGKSGVELGLSAGKATRLGRLIRTCARVSLRPLNALSALFASFALNALCACFPLRASWALNALFALRALWASSTWVTFRPLVARITFSSLEVVERKRKGFRGIRPARSDSDRRSSHAIVYSGSYFPEASSSTSRALRPSFTLWPGIALRPLRPSLALRPGFSGVAFIAFFALRASVAFSALQLPLRYPLSAISGIPHVNGIRLRSANVVHLALERTHNSALQVF